jgi:hypothetical protein
VIHWDIQFDESMTTSGSSSLMGEGSLMGDSAHGGEASIGDGSLAAASSCRSWQISFSYLRQASVGGTSL